MSKWSIEKLINIIDAVVSILKFAIGQFVPDTDE